MLGIDYKLDAIGGRWLRCSFVGYCSIAASLAPCHRSTTHRRLCRLSQAPLSMSECLVTCFHDERGDVALCVPDREPLPLEDITGHAHLRQACGVPIALDEAAYTLQDVHAIVAAQAADVLVLDPHEAGGFTPARKAAGLCEAAGLPVTLHSGGECGLSLAAYAHFAVSTPNLLPAIDCQYPNLARDFLPERHALDGGWLKPPTGIGLGVEPDVGLLAELRTEVIHNPYRDPKRPRWFTTKPAY
jgi:hypothetical protein